MILSPALAFMRLDVGRQTAIVRKRVGREPKAMDKEIEQASTETAPGAFGGPMAQDPARGNAVLLAGRGLGASLQTKLAIGRGSQVLRSLPLNRSGPA
jgi:hypothetical protein